MKILSIVGSPRIQGNTHVLAQKFAEGATRDGAEIEEILL
jgi:multimeric flavodoxin WrbA